MDSRRAKHFQCKLEHKTNKPINYSAQCSISVGRFSFHSVPSTTHNFLSAKFNYKPALDQY